MSTNTDVIIIGAGGFGRELLEYSIDAEQGGWKHHVIGFLDDDDNALDGFHSVPLLGRTSDVGSFITARFIIAMGDPILRFKLAKRVRDAGGSLVSLIHPSAYVASSAQVGHGTITCPFALIGCNSLVGENVAINAYASVGHDANVGDSVVLSPYSSLLGNTKLGDCSMIGTHATVMPGISIGSHSKVSASSVVTKHCDPGSLLIGNPAKGRVMFPS